MMATIDMDTEILGLRQGCGLQGHMQEKPLMKIVMT